jgi:acetylglutamate kinase
LVIKMGGNDLEKPGFVEELAEIVAGMVESQPCILVHGGGRAISQLMETLGLEPEFVDGQRVTGEAALDVVEMILSGTVNKRLVLALLHAGVDALGLSGVDRRLIQAEQYRAEYGRIGEVMAVRGEVLLDLCAQGIVPVVSPVSYGEDGRYNVNADHAAAAVAAAIDASQIVFLTNVPGVRLADGNIAAELTVPDVDRLIDEGVIEGGMIPKVGAALGALAGGTKRAVITDLEGLREGTGTILSV